MLLSKTEPLIKPIISCTNDVKEMILIVLSIWIIHYYLDIIYYQDLGYVGKLGGCK